MNEHVVELHNIYVDKLADLQEKYLHEKDFIYHAMKQYVDIYEEERELKIKLQKLERELTTKFHEESIK